MKIPNTNLYKFMAVLGLVLFLTCVILPCLILELNSNGKNQTQRNLVTLTHEREALVGKIKNYEAAITVADSLRTEQIASASQIEQYRDGIDLRTKQISLEKELLTKQLAHEKTAEIIVLGFLALSVLLIIFGLWGWYYKLQRPLNILIRYELRKE